MMLEGKKALVTGGSRGIGLAIAKEYLKQGAKVVVTGRSMERLEAARESFAPYEPLFLEWDAGDVSVCKEKLEEAANMMGGLDIVVNNAGVLRPSDVCAELYVDQFFKVTPDDFDYVIGIDLKGAFFLCQAAASYMLEHNPGKKKGHIVNICSEMGYRPVASPYGMAKWGIHGITKGLGKLLGRQGICVNGIAPGATTTEMMNWHPGDSTERESHANGRFGTPEEMAFLAAYLASDLGENIVGHVVLCDGGSSLY